MMKEDFVKAFLALYMLGHQNNPDVGVSNIDPLVTLTNRVRQEQGLPNLIQKERLGNSAKAKAKDLETQKYWSHTSSQGKTPWNFIEESEYKYKNAGENLAKGYSDPEVMVRAWLASPTHKEIILSPKYTETGTGTEGNYTVQHFATPQKHTVLDFLLGKMK
jgi:uncharacterized protein YkwD